MRANLRGQEVALESRMSTPRVVRGPTTRVRVSLHVFEGRVVAGESLVAELALKGFLPGVGEDVTLEHVGVGAGEGAVGALVGFGARVGPLRVSVQLAFCLRHEVASLALEAPVVADCEPLTSKSGLSG